MEVEHEEKPVQIREKPIHVTEGGGKLYCYSMPFGARSGVLYLRA